MTAPAQEYWDAMQIARRWHCSKRTVQRRISEFPESLPLQTGARGKRQYVLLTMAELRRMEMWMQERRPIVHK